MTREKAMLVIVSTMRDMEEIRILRAINKLGGANVSMADVCKDLGGYGSNEANQLYKLGLVDYTTTEQLMPALKDATITPRGRDLLTALNYM